jgi:general secretion pathway protein L
MPTWLGLDVGRSKVKAAFVRSAYRKVTLESLFVVDIDEGSDPQAAIRTVVTAALGAATAADGLAIALPGTRAAVRTVKLPASAQKQIADVLPFELEAQVPVEIADSVFDYRVLANRTAVGEEGESGEIAVLVAVARTEDVRARIELIKAASTMEPERVEVGGFPIANLLPYVPALGEEGPIVVVDLGSHSSEVLVLISGEPVFSRTLSCGTSGLPASAPLLGREIRVTLGAFRSTGGAQPTHVYLCGGGAFEQGADIFLSAELGLTCEALPAPSIEMGAAVDATQVAHIGVFAKAIGLALGLGGRISGLDLRRGPLAYERGFAWVREKIPVLAGLACTIIVSFFFSAWAQLHAASNDRDVLEKALATVSKEVLGEETTSASHATELLGQLTAINDEDPLPHADGFDVMVKLSEDIPQSMVHDIEELDVQKGHVVVHGIVGSIPDAESIKTSLKAERCFQDVKITRTTSVVGKEDRQKYVLEFDEKCPEDVKGQKKREGMAAPASSSSAGEKP